MTMGTNVNPENVTPVQSNENPTWKFDPETGKSLGPVEDVVPAEPPKPTHWLHLADGRVIQSVGVVSRWHDSDDPNDKGVQVIGTYEM